MLAISLQDSPKIYDHFFPDPCAGLEGYSAHGTSCFRYYTERVTQTQAETKCQVDGGHLASVHSEDEHTFLVSLVSE